MNFTRGFVWHQIIDDYQICSYILTDDKAGGVTFSLGLMYLSTNSHNQNRQKQAAAIRLQSQLINSLFESRPRLKTESYRSVSLPAQPSKFIDIFKARWNEEIENTFLWFQNIDLIKSVENIEAIIRSTRGKINHSTEQAQSLKKSTI